MTRQDTGKDTDQKSKRPLCTHACRRRCLGTTTALLLALTLTPFAQPTRALADGPAPTRQATAEAAAEVGKVAPEDGPDEALESDVAPEAKGALEAGQDGKSPDQAPGKEGSAVPKDSTGEASPEESRPQAQASAGETPASPKESTSGEATSAQTSAAPGEASREPHAAYTVATGPAAMLAAWATRHPVGACLATGAVALLVYAAFRARTGQQAHQEVTPTSYRRRYHYVL